jgi:hypothetical protein
MDQELKAYLDQRFTGASDPERPEFFRTDLIDIETAQVDVLLKSRSSTPRFQGSWIGPSKSPSSAGKRIG